ncbi:hypothetical protein [Parahaliea mediterranea]|uniref:DUF1145 domain-containing protein n=1 Tax=Parahaliea mediterranea TaxID=651086 RepID=A0A939INZ6_9GAMM|nr:hypothetical protein [Parahaliea mediterranea]MBN7799065.1 hypothetical protein [Parahaliea mediterranea]
MLILKIGLLAVYLAAAASLVVPVLGPGDIYLQYVALALLAIHALETVFTFQILQRHPGGMAQSVLLCLLFGVVHWAPLKKSGS